VLCLDRHTSTVAEVETPHVQWASGNGVQMVMALSVSGQLLSASQTFLDVEVPHAH
jgi:hypothetical protein